MQDISLVRGDAPTTEDAACLAQLLEWDYGCEEAIETHIIADPNAHAVVVSFSNCREVFNFALDKPKEAIEPELLARLAHHLTGHASAIIDLMSDCKELVNIGCRLLAQIHSEPVNLDVQTWFEIREALALHGHPLPPLATEYHYHGALQT